MGKCLMPMLDRRRSWIVAGLLAFLPLVTAKADEKVTLGKSVATAWIYTPADVGVSLGMWKKRGLDVEISSYAGDARLNQAMTGNTVELGLAGSTNIGFTMKGAPVRAVAVMLNAPAFMGLHVPTLPTFGPWPISKGERSP